MTQAPETRYARAADGIHVGYQVVGSGPVDLVFVPYDYSNIEAAWDFPPFVSFVRGLASIGRVLVFDRRGSGTSDRSWTGEAATIEAQMDDIRAVMDAASSRAGVPVRDRERRFALLHVRRDTPASHVGGDRASPDGAWNTGARLPRELEQRDVRGVLRTDRACVGHRRVRP